MGDVLEMDSAWEQYSEENRNLWRRRCRGHLLYAYQLNGVVGWHCTEGGKGYSSSGAKTIDEAKAHAERWAMNFR